MVAPCRESLRRKGQSQDEPPVYGAGRETGLTGEEETGSRRGGDGGFAYGANGTGFNAEKRRNGEGTMATSDLLVRAVSMP
jgi:hypothetical protein